MKTEEINIKYCQIKSHRLDQLQDDQDSLFLLQQGECSYTVEKIGQAWVKLRQDRQQTLKTQINISLCRSEKF